MKGSGQRAHGEKSGGQRIDDHSFFGGSVDKETIMPRGVKLKGESDGEGMGDLLNYEDTAEKIKGQQDLGVKKQRSHPQKPMYRN